MPTTTTKNAAREAGQPHIGKGGIQPLEFGYGCHSGLLRALAASHTKGSYRRTDWAIALLGAMANDPEGLKVVFYGH